jgi:hypothetical protein
LLVHGLSMWVVDKAIFLFFRCSTDFITHKVFFSWLMRFCKIKQLLYFVHDVNRSLNFVAV